MPACKPRRRADERIERLAGHVDWLVSAVAMSARSSLVTHILVRRDEYLKRDTVFGVKASLVRELDEADVPTPDGRRTTGRGRAPASTSFSHPSKDAPDEDVHRIVIPDRLLTASGAARATLRRLCAHRRRQTGSGRRRDRSAWPARRAGPAPATARRNAARPRTVPAVCRPLAGPARPRIDSRSTMCRITWKSSRMPLPPSRSRLRRGPPARVVQLREAGTGVGQLARLVQSRGLDAVQLHWRSPPRAFERGAPG